MLQAQGRERCQWLLTLLARLRGGVLELFERGVDLERIGDVLHTLGSDVSASETADEGRVQVYRKE